MIVGRRCRRLFFLPGCRVSVVFRSWLSGVCCFSFLVVGCLLFFVPGCRVSVGFRSWLSGVCCFSFLVVGVSVVFRLSVSFSVGGAQLCFLDIKYHFIEYKYLICLNAEHPQFLRTKIAGGGGREGFTICRCLKKLTC